MQKRTVLVVAVVAAIAAGGVITLVTSPSRPAWTDSELSVLRGLWIGSLKALPPDPSNRLADDPRAAELGHRFFFDTGFSINGSVACASCHLPEREFQDGRPLGVGVGRVNRRTMTLVGVAYSPWFFWDGRKDSLWAQALGPMESSVEHGGNRTMYVHRIAQHYRVNYEALFGPLPDTTRLPPSAGPVDDATARAAWDSMPTADREVVSRVYANMGKAIAAYERKIMPGPSRFDRYVEAVLARDVEAMRQTLATDEVAGLRLFIGKANCINCHNGPLLTNNDFHNTGVPSVETLPEDSGRALGAKQVLADEFNCLSRYSDATPAACGELRFLKIEGEQLERAFKPPSLRNVAERPPYMHAGQFSTLEEVLSHYNRAPAAPHGHTELRPLSLSEQEIGQLVAFLKALSGPLSTPAEWLEPPG